MRQTDAESRALGATQTDLSLSVGGTAAEAVTVGHDKVSTSSTAEPEMLFKQRDGEEHQRTKPSYPTIR